jgi:hypothetical protein
MQEGVAEVAELFPTLAEEPAGDGLATDQILLEGGDRRIP